MTNTPPKPWPAAILGLVFAIGIAVAPLSAHEGEKHPAPAAAASASPPAPMSPEDMPVTDMAWPSGDDAGGMTMSHEAKPTTFEGRLLAWIGTWHPAAVHFPIALLLTVALLEFLAVVRRRPVYAASSRILLAVGAVGAFVAAPMGWLNAGLPTAEDDLSLTIHRWLGTALPFLLLALWRLKRPADQAAVRASSRGYEVLLAVTVLLIVAQAYFGAVITHGAEHLRF